MIEHLVLIFNRRYSMFLYLVNCTGLYKINFILELLKSTPAPQPKIFATKNLTVNMKGLRRLSRSVEWGRGGWYGSSWDVDKVVVSRLECFVKFVKIDALRCLNLFSSKGENYSQHLWNMRLKQKNISVKPEQLKVPAHKIFFRK